MEVEFKSHVNEVIYKKEQAVEKALEMIGLKAEKYAKKLSPVDTGRLRSSITHAQLDKETEVIGTNVEYAPYVPCRIRYCASEATTLSETCGNRPHG